MEDSVRRGERRKLRWVIGIIVAILLIAIVVYLFIKPRQPHVVTTTVHRQTIANKIFVSGDVHPLDRQVVQPGQLPTPVDQVYVKVGQTVHQGDLLLRTQSQAQSAQLSAAKIQVNQAQASLNQTQAQADATPAALRAQFTGTLASLKSSLAQAKAQLASAQAAYNQTAVHATIDGTVLLLNPNGIAADGSQAPIIELVGQAKQAVVTVSQVDAVHVKAGQKATVDSDAYPNKTWNATVSNVALYAGASSSNGSGQVEVDLTLPPDCPIPFSYQVNVHITSETHKNVLTVPYSALTQVGNDYEVYALENHRAVLKKVKLGITTDTDVEVTSGLKQGEVIVQNPPAGLSSGQTVDVTGHD